MNYVPAIGLEVHAHMDTSFERIMIAPTLAALIYVTEAFCCSRYAIGAQHAQD